MSIRVRKGKFTYDIWVNQHRRERRFLDCSTLAEAEAIESQRRFQLGLTAPNVAEKVFEKISPTFESFLPEQIKIWQSLASFKKYYSKYSHLLCRHFGKMRLDEITTSRIHDYKNVRLESCGAWSVRHELKLLRQILKLATEQGLTKSNSALKVAFPRRPLPSKETYSLEQQNQLFKILPKPFVFYFFTLLRTGRRPIELARAKVEDHHYQESTLDYVDAKTHRSESRPLLPDVNELLNSLSQGKSRKDLIFKNADGEMWRDTRKTLYRCQKKIGMERLTLYRCRATFATDMLNKGVEMKIVSWLLGHLSVTTTETYYAHLRPDYGATKLLEYGLKLNACAATTAHDILCQQGS